MMEKYGPDKLNDHFMIMDTICDATQVHMHAPCILHTCMHPAFLTHAHLAARACTLHPSRMHPCYLLTHCSVPSVLLCDVYQTGMPRNRVQPECTGPRMPAAISLKCLHTPFSQLLIIASCVASLAECVSSSLPAADAGRRSDKMLCMRSLQTPPLLTS